MTTSARLPQQSGGPRQRYAHSLRRARLVYGAVLAVVVVGFAAIFTVVVATGSAAHATLHTVDDPPASVPLGTTSATLTRGWATTDRAAQGDPRWRGTIVTWEQHTVRGRDARTGVQTWSYTRTDRTVCSVGQIDGVAVAVFGHSGNCDEVDAFDAGSGARKWQRTLDENGVPIDGTPAFQYSETAFVVRTGRGVYAINPDSGIDSFVYTRYGCRITHAVVGTSGVLIDQTCGSAVQCSGIKFCGRGRQLLLDPVSGRSDKPSDDNKDQITWSRIGYSALPVSAGDTVLAFDFDARALTQLQADNGRTIRRVPLSPAPTEVGLGTAINTDSGELVTFGANSYLIGAHAGRPTWATTSTGPPTVTDVQSPGLPQLGRARITTTTSAGITALAASTGAATSTYRVAVPAGSSAYPLGTGFVVASASGTVVYR